MGGWRPLAAVAEKLAGADSRCSMRAGARRPILSEARGSTPPRAPVPCCPTAGPAQVGRAACPEFVPGTTEYQRMRPRAPSHGSVPSSARVLNFAASRRYGGSAQCSSYPHNRTRRSWPGKRRVRRLVQFSLFPFPAVIRGVSTLRSMQSLLLLKRPSKLRCHPATRR